MEIRLFGELEAIADGEPMPVRGAKQRALLALLALQRGQSASAGRLIDALWGDGQAANPANALQAQIGQLRRTLGPGVIVTTEAGYALTAPIRRSGDSASASAPQGTRRSICHRWPKTPKSVWCSSRRCCHR